MFVNMAVADVEASKAFFGRLGFQFDPQFTGQAFASLILSETHYAMLMTPAQFAQFSPHPLADAKAVKEVLIALTCDSRAEVDDIVDKAIAAGATTHEGPQDHGCMYARSFMDLDGHAWNWFWMDPNAVPPKPA
jgi:predicted lactoylglutathione lyase